MIYVLVKTSNPSAGAYVSKGGAGYTPHLDGALVFPSRQAALAAAAVGEEPRSVELPAPPPPTSPWMTR